MNQTKLRRLVKRGLSGLNRPRSDRGYNKVFCLGWLKTGTTSFGNAMRRLGFLHCGYDDDVFRRWYKNEQLARVLEYASRFESFDDLPWNKSDFLPQIDSAFPNSKYVLLLRDEQAWLSSYLRWTRKHGRTVDVDADKQLESFRVHNEIVTQYFADREPGVLLPMNIFEGDGYPKLCGFLNVPVVDEPFPHVNKT